MMATEAIGVLLAVAVLAFLACSAAALYHHGASRSRRPVVTLYGTDRSEER